MFRLDHLMVEVSEPEKVAHDVAGKLGLPFAWPLVETEDYSSTGINLGDLNIEFIHFTKRFGLKNTNRHGFSGVAFSVNTTAEECQTYLHQKGFTHRIGETAEAHTTITIEEELVFPTLFLVKYHFDTTGWKTRLQTEFRNAQGGTYNIHRFKSLEIAQPDPKGLLKEMNIISSDKNRMTLTGGSGQKQTLTDLVPNLEIVIE